MNSSHKLSPKTLFKNNLPQTYFKVKNNIKLNEIYTENVKHFKNIYKYLIYKK